MTAVMRSGCGFNMKKKFLFLFVLVLFIEKVAAHCPLCTIGAGAAAGAAVWLGVSKVVVALFIGGFAMSMGMWFARVVKKKYIPFQKALIILGVFLLTVWPLMPIFSAIGPFYISFIGEYGTTFALNYSLFSSLFGGMIVFAAPSLSKGLTKIRKGKMLPFQGILITLVTLLIVGGVIQLVV